MKLRHLLPLVMGTVFTTTAAQADFNLGVRAGAMLVGFDNTETTEDPVSVSASIGYEFDFLKGLSIEAEASRTVSEGVVEGIGLEVESQGAYVAYQTAGTFYVRGRVGFMDAALVAEDFSEDEGGETYGIAIGWRLSGFDVELDYTAVDDDVTFVSLGFRF